MQPNFQTSDYEDIHMILSNISNLAPLFYFHPFSSMRAAAERYYCNSHPKIWTVDCPQLRLTELYSHATVLIEGTTIYNKKWK